MPQEPSLKPPAPARDPLTRVSRLAQILSIGLIAVACFLTHPNSLNRTNARGLPITLDAFSEPVMKAAVAAVHTRATWVTLAVIAACIAMSNTRSNPLQRTLIRRWGTVSLLVTIALHAAAQGYLQSQSPLTITVRGMVPGDTSESISRLKILEGTRDNWQLLFAGDLLFSAPVLLTWLLHLLRTRL